jgi:hypothetical protein
VCVCVSLALLLSISLRQGHGASEMLPLRSWRCCAQDHAVTGSLSAPSARSKPAGCVLILHSGGIISLYPLPSVCQSLSLYCSLSLPVAHSLTHVFNHPPILHEIWMDEKRG